MRRKTSHEADSLGDPISTQEYIRRAVEEPGGDDDDFSCNPWLLAVDFVRSAGLVGDDGVAIGTPLSVIRNWGKMNKIDQVVAIVKTCTPNGLGDFMVTLKDPTGTIDGSIHHRVFTESEFGRDICVGAVLILQKVAVFAPSRTARYLNMTLNTIVKVISKDSGTLLKQNNPTSPVVENQKQAMMREKAPGGTQGIMDNLRQNAQVRWRTQTHVDKEVKGGDSAFRISCQSDESRRNQSEKQSNHLVRQNAGEVMRGRETRTSTTNEDQHVLVCEQAFPLIQSNRGTQLDSIRSSNPATKFFGNPNKENENIFGEDNENINIVMKQKKQPVISKGSLPKWTDDQLNELLEFD